MLHAEDSIRFTSVTGVQTCALPIWREHDEVARVDRLVRVRHAGRHEHGATGRYVDRAIDEAEAQRPVEIGRASCRKRVDDWQRGQRLTMIQQIADETTNPAAYTSVKT